MSANRANNQYLFLGSFYLPMGEKIPSTVLLKLSMMKKLMFPPCTAVFLPLLCLTKVWGWRAASALGCMHKSQISV